MPKIIKTIIKAAPALIGLFRSKTPKGGKGIVKSGVASLTIGGLISTGKLSTSGIDSTLLLILSIMETLAYLYGGIALTSGAAQSDPLEDLLKGKGEGLSKKQSKILGQEWLKQVQKNNSFDQKTNSLFDDDYSDLKIKARDISKYSTRNSTKNK